MIDTFNQTKGDDAEKLLAVCDLVSRLTRGHVEIFLYRYCLPIQILLGILGNTFSITVLLSPKIKSRVTVFLAAICCVDVSLLAVHFFDVLTIYPTFYRSKAFREFYYNTYVFIHSFSNICASSATWLLLGVSFERFTSFRSRTARLSLSIRQAFSLVAVICLGASAISFYQFFAHSYRPFDDSVASSWSWMEKCYDGLVYKRIQANRATYILIWKIVAIFAVGFIPSILMIILDVALVRQLRTITTSDHINRLINSEQETHSTRFPNRNQCDRGREETTVVTAFLSWFLITNLPSEVLFLWDIMQPFQFEFKLFELMLPRLEIRYISGNIVNSFLLWGKASNFAVFFIASKTFRHQFYEMVQGFCVKWAFMTSRKKVLINENHIEFRTY
ncbi:unnamed protein product, partial [Mesorhabditis belari]|uniref:G-protein coupled receptors family 1 profile domain-containing protein n=1 Tax=Mesorhabditis belari TaxID=2138241 RepID=A0AAF3ETT6_9BILA